jgi:hypothetical protein
MHCHDPETWCSLEFSSSCSLVPPYCRFPMGGISVGVDPDIYYVKLAQVPCPGSRVSKLWIWTGRAASHCLPAQGQGRTAGTPRHSPLGMRACSESVAAEGWAERDDTIGQSWHSSPPPRCSRRASRHLQRRTESSRWAPRGATLPGAARRCPAAIGLLGSAHSDAEAGTVLSSAFGQPSLSEPTTCPTRQPAALLMTLRKRNQKTWYAVVR